MAAGDFGVVRGSGIEAEIIRDATHSNWSHAFILINDEDDLIEALGSGVALGNLSKYGGKEYRIVSPPLTDAQRTQAVATACSMVGEPYDRFAIAGFVIDAITHGTFVIGQDKHSICSAAVAICYASAGVPPPQDVRRTSPGDLMRWWKQTPE